MKLDKFTLRDVHNILSELLGKNLLLLDCMKYVHIYEKDDPKNLFGVNTMAIDRIGNLHIYRSFFEDLKDMEELKTVLLHELYHPICGDTYRLMGLDEKDPDVRIKAIALNIAQDCRINAAIYHRYIKTGKIRTNFFERFYSEAPKKDKDGNIIPISEDELRIRKLLKNNSTFKDSDPLAPYYDYFYNIADVQDYGGLYDEVLNILKKNKNKNEQMIQNIIDLLLGGHSLEEKQEDGEGGPSISIDDLDVSQDLKDKLKEAIDQASGIIKEQLRDSKGHGTSSTVEELILAEADDTGRKIDIRLFKELSFNCLFRNIRLGAKKTRRKIIKKAIFPQRLHARDINLLAGGIDIVSWRHDSLEEYKEKVLLPIYLDVSGSMYSSLPEIIQLILNIDADLDSIWGFSNQVFLHTLDDLKNNKIKSTGGTDFDCIIEHALENKHKSILVITDGDAHCRKPKEKIPGIDEVIVVLTDGYCREDNWFSTVYKETRLISEVTI